MERRRVKYNATSYYTTAEITCWTDYNGTMTMTVLLLLLVTTYLISL